MDGIVLKQIREARKQQRIKKLYLDAVECARAEGARGKNIRTIAMDYIAVLKIKILITPRSGLCGKLDVIYLNLEK